MSGHSAIGWLIHGDARTRARLAWAAALLAPLIIAAVGLLLLEQVTGSNHLRAAEQASQERRALLMTVLSAHQDLETGQRGYLIAHDPSFLVPYYAGDRTLDRIFPALHSDYAGNGGQLARLTALEATSSRKIAFMERTIALARQGELDQTRQLVVGGRGRVLMDRIRTEISALLASEVANLRALARSSEAAIDRLRILSFGLLAILLLLLGFAALAIRETWAARRLVMEELDDTASRRAAILDSAMDAIFTLNPSGGIEAANAAASRMFGWTEDEMRGRDVGSLFARPPPIGVAAEMLRDMQLEPGKPGTLQEIIGRRADGTTFPTDVAITIARLSQGMRYVAVVRDISERSRIDQMKAEFVSTVSHELRTPLSSIAGSLGLLAGGAAGPLPERADRLISIARNNADRLVRLINDILDIEKLESGEMRFDCRPLDLLPAMHQAIDEVRGYADSFSVNLRCEGDGPVIASADPDRLAQVLTNLLSNAIKFSPAGETVVLRIEPGADRHRLVVEDRGPGIPDAFRSRIFGKFAQADSSDSRAKGGTGLGLSIVRKIVDRFGGEVGFDSVEGRGSSFFVDLPAHSEQPVATETVRAVGDSTDRYAILHVDDDPDLLRMVADALSDLADVVSAQTLAAAGSALTRRDFDLVILDLTLRDGHGADLLPELRERQGDVPVIIYSAEDADRRYADQADAFLTKARTPISRLVDTARELVARKSRAA